MRVKGDAPLLRVAALHRVQCHAIKIYGNLRNYDDAATTKRTPCDVIRETKNIFLPKKCFIML